MPKLPLFFLALLCFLSACNNTATPDTNTSEMNTKPTERPAYAIAIHGGAGTILKENMTPEKEKLVRDALNAALDKGSRILAAGGSALDAVEQTIMILEDAPYFNAGKGAVFTAEGKNELDASFMDGKTQNAGAIGGVTNVKNPITLARAVLEKSHHVLLTGKGAEAFAKENGIELASPDYFKTEDRLKSLEKAKEEEAKSGFIFDQGEDFKFGTVGCAALDKNGNLAAGTSTGGMTNKKYNRIGDSPIIGAGTYADNATCAVSSTGHGEFFIRYVVAHDIAARMAYGNQSFQEAANEVVKQKLVEKGGAGGIIGVDKDGNVAMPFNTPGMYRGYAKPGERVVEIYEEKDRVKTTTPTSVKK